MDALQRAVVELVEGRGTLELVETDGLLESADVRKRVGAVMEALPDLPRGPVFVPLGNAASLLLPFLGLLGAGYRPVVLPAVLPPGQRDALAEAFPVIPFYDVATGSFVDRAGRACDPVEVEDDYDLVLPTSGSTGRPRLIVGHGDRIRRAVDAIEASQGIAGFRSTAAFLPAHFSYCLVNQVLWSLFRGARLVLTPGLAMAAAAVELLVREQPDFVCMVAQQLRLLVAFGFDEEELCLPGTKVVNFAGGPFPFDCWGSLVRFFPAARFNNNYGCTEAFPRVSARRVGGGDEEISHVGAPIGDLRLEIVDDAGRPLGTGEIGRIRCVGSTTGLGTLDERGGVVPFSETGVFPTGDWGHLDAAGELHVHGRADQIINVGGERISLIRIEHVTRECPGVDDAVATAEREANGEQWPLVVVTSPSPVAVETLRRHYAEHLPRGAWPRRILHAAEWPLLPSDKPDRKGIIEGARTGRYLLLLDETDGI